MVFMNYDTIGQGPAKPIPTEIATVEGFLKKIADHHAMWYQNNPDGEFRPLLMVLCENGDLIPILVAGFGEDEEKTVFCEQMRETFKKWRVKSYVFAMEAWMSSMSVSDLNEDGTIDSSKSPSKQPDRKEVVFTIAVDKDGNKAQNCLEIIRDYQGKPHLIPLDALSGVDFAGRFAELLR